MLPLRKTVQWAAHVTQLVECLLISTYLHRWKLEVLQLPAGWGEERQELSSQGLTDVGEVHTPVTLTLSLPFWLLELCGRSQSQNSHGHMTLPWLREAWRCKHISYLCYLAGPMFFHIDLLPSHSSHSLLWLWKSL